MKKVYWETKDGKKIDINEMDIEHLRNVLKMIVKHNKKKRNNSPMYFMEPYAYDYQWK